ncbi:MAG: hypothetical protein ABIF40_04275 [archaeon]
MLEIECLCSTVYDGMRQIENNISHYVPEGEVVYLEDQKKYYQVISCFEKVIYSKLLLSLLKDPQETLNNNNGYWHYIAENDYRLP